MTDGNQLAGEGQVFVCGACGKRSRDLYGEQKISRGWDESCMLNAVVCLESSLVFNDDGGMVIKADAVREVTQPAREESSTPRRYGRGR